MYSIQNSSEAVKHLGYYIFCLITLCTLSSHNYFRPSVFSRSSINPLSFHTDAYVYNTYLDIGFYVFIKIEFSIKT